MSPLPKQRPTLRDVAAAAQVSHMTVSRVVSGSQAVAAKTVERVNVAIEKLGYRPDPALSALAAYRSNGSGSHAQQSVLAFLDCDATDYSRIVLDGARGEAELHGYSIERVQLAREPAEQQKWSRRLFNRGVRGLLFGPSAAPWVFGDWLWPEFAAVSLGALSHQPAMHSVAMDYFEGAMSGFVFLQKAGCERIGLAIEPKLDARTGHRWLGGYCAAAKQAQKPVLWAGSKWRSPAVRQWMEKERVDGLLTIDLAACKAAQALGIPVAFLNEVGCAHEVPHLKLDPKTIGIEGVRLLHHLVLRREFDLPTEPKQISLRGTWVA